MKNNYQENIRNHEPIIRTAYFRFYEELNDFIPRDFFKKNFSFSYTGIHSVKNLIEAIGVPHTEVDLILVDGISVGFNHQIKGGEQVSVYPVFESIDISPAIRLRAKPLRKIRFIVDANLGKLAKKLRLLGFDTLYKNDFNDEEIVKISLTEKRIILTRDFGILKYGSVLHGTWVRSDDPKIQLKEVIERLQLKNLLNPFTRCSECNGQLKRIDKEQLISRIRNDTLHYLNVFWECGDCNKIYWKGSHFDKINDWLKKEWGYP